MRIGSAAGFLEGATTHVDAPRCREAGVEDLVAAVCAEGEPDTMSALQAGMAAWRELRGTDEPGLYLMLEGCEPLVRMEDPEPLLADLEMATLTWNHANSLAGGVKSDTGLTHAGRRWARRLADRGVLLDVSHLCARSRRELLRLHDGPVVASHSNAAALCRHPRNLPDEDVREIASRGGVVGITFVPAFLGEAASLQRVVDHVAHTADVAGVDAVAFGSDFDGIGTLPEGIAGCQSWPAVLEEMERRGFNDGEIGAVAAGNWRRLLPRPKGRDQR
jgi:microsomal dipeptidase-like Zn-dependent dipeptidase